MRTVLFIVMCAAVTGITKLLFWKPPQEVGRALSPPWLCLNLQPLLCLCPSVAIPTHVSRRGATATRSWWKWIQRLVRGHRASHPRVCVRCSGRAAAERCAPGQRFSDREKESETGRSVALQLGRNNGTWRKTRLLILGGFCWNGAARDPDTAEDMRTARGTKSSAVWVSIHPKGSVYTPLFMLQKPVLWRWITCCGCAASLSPWCWLSKVCALIFNDSVITFVSRGWTMHWLAAFWFCNKHLMANKKDT